MWTYEQPVTILFGEKQLEKLSEIVVRHNWQQGIIIATPYAVRKGWVEQLREQCKGRITDVFSQITPNPDVTAVDACAESMRQQQNGFVVAVGGGSTIDLAKAAATICRTTESIRSYLGTGKILPKAHLPLIAIPTTAGTGSEITAVSVLSDREFQKKVPLVSPNFYPEYAIIDPTLTYDLPPYITAYCGIHVLSQALEGYWGIHHQPACDAVAIQAAKLVFQYLPRAHANGYDVEARQKMCEASVLAGMAIALAKTTAPHACSYPLTNRYSIPSGEACGLTLDYFTRFNGKHDERVQLLAKELGFPNSDTLADAILALKQRLQLRCDIKDFHIPQSGLDGLVVASQHPNLANNPVPVTDDVLYDLYRSLM